MADIFISYSKAHRSLTEELAAELEAKGFTVWWDTALVSGDSFRDVILAELSKARAAIVIWTAASVKSDWVIAEATRARARGILIPVRDAELDVDDIPMPFGVLHTDVVAHRPAIFAALTKLDVVASSPSPMKIDPSPTALTETAIGEALALAHWQAIQNTNSAGKLREFLGEFGASKVARLARERVAQLEAAAWGRLPNRRMAEALAGFLQEFPDGAHAEAAEAELANLGRGRERRAFELARQADAIAAVERFLADYPESHLAAEARALRASLLAREEKYQSTIAGNEPAVLKAFLADYPKGPAADDIRRRLRQLEPRRAWQPSRRLALAGSGVLGVGTAAVGVSVWQGMKPTGVRSDGPEPVATRPEPIREKSGPKPTVSTARINLHVNGKVHTIDADPDMPLLYALRNDIGLNNPHFGCGLAQCGACTVHLDGQPIHSCVTPVSAVGSAKVVTLAGLGTPENPHPIQTAYVEEQVPQCGYCIDGWIMTAAALLSRVRKPTDAQIKDALTGLKCRCGTHVSIMRAVKRAAEMMG